MSRLKELAKFAAGMEAFHAAANGYFWLSGVTLHMFGVVTTPTMHLWSALLNGVASVALGVYAWSTERPDSTGRR